MAEDKRSIGQPVVLSLNGGQRIVLNCEGKGASKVAGAVNWKRRERGVVRPKWIVCLAHFGGKGVYNLTREGGGALAIANPFLIPIPEVVGAVR